MNNLTQIIHKLEKECQALAKFIIKNNKPIFTWTMREWEDKLVRYDLYQSIITILEKIDVDKMWNKIIGNSSLVHKDIRQFETLDLAKSLTNYLGGRDE